MFQPNPQSRFWAVEVTGATPTLVFVRDNMTVIVPDFAADTAAGRTEVD